MVQVGSYAEGSHSSLFEGESVDYEVSIGFQLSESRNQGGCSTCITAKLNGVEVKHVLDIGHINILKTDGQGVGGLVACYAVNGDMAVVVAYEKVVYEQVPC